ncbi:uncharacterized protein LOC18432419 [Amborella trichopoda]|uniref:Uncharacterized protein n=1 Tax=Amborella trichopoda TaxID=13333 RepID=W1P8L9_AMBTC|nr:uncharacterized protein LOC18432419 [Amborella trichopoda]XP_020521703.1 uncharacterized protein LOC18432419 [Amborella trichopoda]XP_020521704.1 uncharacterized protein LOC18432419 [Amborella trichopoda]ERN04263.1 hypothetical protein AMTR_s00077p00162920 [Amborella trichopoda]|eukprot:XP_006842588.1 uncharacterized protein LOC18432419 [Amborella trichopoda]
MKSIWGFLKLRTLILFTVVLSFISEVHARITSNDVYEGQQLIRSSRHLDSLLQGHAYKAFIHPHTGVIYGASVPSNMTGIELRVVRLRSGSMRVRGLGYREFSIPRGVIETPYVKRLALVYQNLSNWSSYYYDVPGYSFITPVLGLLGYNALNLSATNLPELSLRASMKPISINFSGMIVPRGAQAKCVQFHLNGSIELSDMVLPNVCYTSTQGHFAVIIESKTPSLSPSPESSPQPIHKKKDHLRAWKIAVGSVVAGVAGLGLLGLIAYVFLRYRKRSNLVNMEKQAIEGENLRIEEVGNMRAPVAAEIRTRPALENEDFQ